MIRLARRYAELATTTNFSFLRGASHPEEMVARAAALGLAGIGVADRNTLAGVVRAHVYARENREALGAFRVVTGARLAFVDGAPDVIVYPQRPRRLWAAQPAAQRGQPARAERRVPSRFRRTAGERRGAAGDRHAPFSPCGGSRTPDEGRAIRRGEGRRHPSSRPPARGEGGMAPPQLRDAFTDRLWIGACPTYGADMRGGLADARGAGAKTRRAADRGQRRPHARSRAAAARRRRRLHPRKDDARGGRAADPGQRRAPSQRARKRWRACSPRRPTRWKRRCASSTESPSASTSSPTAIPEELREGYATPQAALEAFAEAGARARYPDGVPDRVRAALDHELKLVAQLGYAPYFLTVHDIVRFARSKDILCQGRGSAANSTVCYCLGITEVDPSRFDLLFERFVSPERGEPPDIDVDFEHERREEVIQYIYQRYGRERAGLGERGRDLPHPLGDPRDRQGLRPVRRCDRRAQQHRLGPELGADRRRSGALGRARSERADAGADAEAGGRTGRLSAPPDPAQRRLRHRPRPARRDRADHERGDGRAHDRRMGQERSRRARHSEDRRAGARHADRDEQEPQAARGALRRAADARLDPVGRGVRLRDDPARRHGRRVPDREPRPDVDAAAAQAREVLRSRHRSGDRPPGADPGRHGPSLSAPPPGTRADDLSVARSWRRCSARRSACRCSRSRR